MITFSLFAIFLSCLIGLLFVSLFLRECYKNPPFIFLSVLLFSIITKFISVVFLELNPIYMTETGQESFFNYASLRFVIFQTILLYPASIASRHAYSALVNRTKGHYEHPELRGPNRDSILVLWVLIGIMGLQIVNLALSSGLPIFNSNVSRWNYWEVYASFSFLPSVFGKLMIFYPFVLGIYLYDIRFYKRSTRAKIRGLTLCYFSYLFLTGQTVNGIVAPFGYLLAAYFSCSGYHLKKIEILRIVKWGMITAASLSVVGFIALQERGISELAGSALYTFLYRVFVLTGSSYWTVDHYVFSLGYSGTISDLVGGMRNLILLVMPGPLADAYIARGVNLSGGLPSMAVYSAGLFGGVIILAILGIVMGAFSSIVYFYTVKRHFVALLILSYIQLWTISSYTLSSFEQLADFKYSLFLLLFLVVIIVKPRPALSKVPLRGAIHTGTYRDKLNPHY